MPSLANMTIKKADGTTDTTYYGLVRAAGASPAVWKASGPHDAAKPELRVSSRDLTKPGQYQREVRVTYVYPEVILDSTTGLYTVANRARFTGAFETARGLSDAAANEAAFQLCNLFAHSLTKDMLYQRFAAA